MENQHALRYGELVHSTALAAFRANAMSFISRFSCHFFGKKLHKSGPEFLYIMPGIF
jgi:hypothetical protein